MKYIRFIVALFAFVLMSCKSSTEPDQKGVTAEKDTLIFKYDSLTTYPYSQSIMVSGYLANIFIYGAAGKFSVYNTVTKTTSHLTTVNDTITWRWDGAFVAVDTMMYIFALPIDRQEYYKVLVLNPRTYEIRPTSATLAFTQHTYPTSAVIGKNILLLYPTHDSLFVFDTSTLTGQFVSQNKLRIQYNSKIYSSCVYENDFYVYSMRVKQLHKINTQTFTWQEIIIPDSIKSQIDPYALGGMIENKLCLFNQRNGSGVIVAYDLVNHEWLIGPKNTRVAIAEPSFYSTNASLYVGDVFSKSLWQISLSH